MRNSEMVIMPKTLRNLRALGENIKLARLRRNFSQKLICERAGISRPTLIRVEQGSPDVCIGVYANVMLAIGNADDELANVLKEDRLGRTIMELGLKTPKRGAI